MKRLLYILVGLTAIAALGFYVMSQYGDPRDHDYEMATVLERQPVSITLLCSDEKEAWIRKSASDFGRRRPDIDIKVQVMSSEDGLNAILSRQVTPTLWSPAETMMLQYLEYRWQQEFGVNLFELDGEDAPRSLARSPLVWISWKSRIDAITGAIKAGQIKPESVWADMGCAGVPHDPDARWPATTTRWEDLAAFKSNGANGPNEPGTTMRSMASWGDVQFFHTDPTRSSAGFLAIYLMSYQFLGQPAQVTAPMLDRDPFITWFRRCQRLHKDFPNSLHTLTHRLFQFGPDHYDIVVTYENLALQNMVDWNNRWSEQPYLYYPPATAWADHPIVILNGSTMPRDQREAARDWIAFLLSPDRQRSLISFGLRPVRQRITLRDQRTDNPFLSEARYNAQLEPSFQSPPDLSGQAIDHLIEIWRNATGYY